MWVINHDILIPCFVVIVCPLESQTYIDLSFTTWFMIHMTKAVDIEFLKVKTCIVNCELIWSSSFLLCYLMMITYVAINCMYDILVNFFFAKVHAQVAIVCYSCVSKKFNSNHIMVPLKVPSNFLFKYLFNNKVPSQDLAKSNVENWIKGTLSNFSVFDVSLNMKLLVFNQQIMLCHLLIVLLKLLLKL
jgi:hypothetical protein